MNHFKNIHEQVQILQDKADLECSETPHSDLAVIVRDLAAEVALLAKLLAEREKQ